LNCDVEGTDEFADWFTDLGEDEQVSVGRVVELLVEHGPALPFPYSSRIETSRHHHIRELLEFLAWWGSSALVQRLGYFLDLHGMATPEKARRALVDLLRPHSKIQLGSRGKWGTTGRLVRPWNVVENVPRDVLISREEQLRHRVVFDAEERTR